MEEKLEEIIENYYTTKSEADALKKEVDSYNKDIKDNFTALGIDEFSTKSGLVAKVSVTTKETFNEPALIEKLVELGAKEAIELVPTINWDIIEDMIYNGKLNAAELAPYKEEKKVETLRVTKKKGE